MIATCPHCAGRVEVVVREPVELELPPPTAKISPHDLPALVAAAALVTSCAQQDLGSKKREAVWARWFVFGAMRLAGYTDSHIERRCLVKHGTVPSAMARHAELLDVDRRYRQAWEMFIGRIAL